MTPRFVSLAVGASLLFLSHAGRAQELPAKPSGAIPTGKDDPAYTLITEAIYFLNQAHDPNDALDKLDAAIKLNPRSKIALVLRANIYGEQKRWVEGDSDLSVAERIAPTDKSVKLELAEFKLAEKHFDEARLRYTAFLHDPDQGDFAAYTIYLCDLLGGHGALASKELDAFNQYGSRPSYYFSNAASCLVHQDIPGARDWLGSAARIYALPKIAPYAQSLHDLDYLPIPVEPAK